jgi:DNA-binding MarR family transcriptional regulator
MAEKIEAPIRVSAGHERRYKGSEKLATEVIINLLRAEGLASAELNRRFRPYGLSTGTFNVLMILEGAPEPLCPWEIGERLLVTRGTVTGLLDSLERAGLITRSRHPEDRRMLLIELTEAGRALLRRVWVDHFPAEKTMTAPLSQREKETLIRLLGKLQAHLLERSKTAG